MITVCRSLFMFIWTGLNQCSKNDWEQAAGEHEKAGGEMLTFLVRENAYISNLTMHHTLWKLDFHPKVYYCYRSCWHVLNRIYYSSVLTPCYCQFHISFNKKPLIQKSCRNLAYSLMLPDKTCNRQTVNYGPMCFLQGINLRAADMATGAQSFSAMAKELLRTTKNEKGSS